MLAIVTLLCCLLTTVLSCARDSQHQRVITVAVASSLLPVVEEMRSDIENEIDASLTVISGAAGVLAEQIRHAAPVDVFLSADERFTSLLAKENLIDRVSLNHLATVSYTHLTLPTSDLV